jgi:hypothetical protein
MTKNILTASRKTVGDESRKPSHSVLPRKQAQWLPPNGLD